MENTEDKRIVCILKIQGRCKQDRTGTRKEFDICMDEMEKNDLI